MSLFNNLKTYSAGYSISSREKLNAAKLGISSGVVVDSEYGLSVCFTLLSGGKKYIPVSRDIDVAEGEIVDMNTLELIELTDSTTGNKIIRAEFETE